MKIIALIIIALMMSACSSTIDTTGHKEYKSLHKDTKKIETNVSLSIIKTGEGSSLEAFVFEGGSWFSTFKISHSSFLIKHPKGNLLIDTGLGKNVEQGFDEEFPWYLKPIFAFKKDKAVVDVLKENKINIKGIILTHAHWDHASGVEDFANTPIYTTKEELAFAKTEWDDVAYMKHAIDSQDIQWDFVTFSDGAYENFESSYDFYGDDTIVLVPLKGHSPGQVGIFINTKESRYFIVGDTTWAYEALINPREKYWYSRSLADADEKQSVEAILQVHALMQQQPKIHVITSHDYLEHKKLGFFPNELN